MHTFKKAQQLMEKGYVMGVDGYRGEYSYINGQHMKDQIPIKLTVEEKNNMWFVRKPHRVYQEGYGRQGWHGDSEGHARAGRLGGLVVSQDREHMRRIGRLGGTMSGTRNGKRAVHS